MPDETTATPLIDGDAVNGALTAVASSSSLVHHLTNDVTTSETANVTLHWGGLPVMADAPAEAGDMAAGADALVLNTGTATTTDVDTMVDAGRRANETDIPVVLDPLVYGIAGECAADSNPAGSASYRRAFIDTVAALADQPPAVAVETRITDRPAAGD